MKKIVAFFTLLISSICTYAGPRIIDEDTNSTVISPGLASVLAIAFAIIMIIAIASGLDKDKNGKRDSGCLGLLVINIIAALLAIFFLSR